MKGATSLNSFGESSNRIQPHVVRSQINQLRPSPVRLPHQHITERQKAERLSDDHDSLKNAWVLPNSPILELELEPELELWLTESRWFRRQYAQQQKLEATETALAIALAELRLYSALSKDCLGPVKRVTKLDGEIRIDAVVMISEYIVCCAILKSWGRIFSWTLAGNTFSYVWRFNPQGPFVEMRSRQLMPKRLVPKLQRQEGSQLGSVLKRLRSGQRPNEVVDQQPPIRARRYEQALPENISFDVFQTPDRSGKATIEAWKHGPGRSKSWKSCPSEKTMARRQHPRQRLRAPSRRRQSYRHSKQFDVLSEPTLILERRARSGKANPTASGRRSQVKKPGAIKHNLVQPDNDDIESYPLYSQNSEKQEFETMKITCDGTKDGGSQEDRVPKLNPAGISAARSLSSTTRNAKLTAVPTTPPWLQNCEILYCLAMYHGPTLNSNPGRPGRSRRGIHGLQVPQLETFDELHQFFTESWGRIREKCSMITMIQYGEKTGNPADVAKLRKMIRKWKTQLDSLRPVYLVTSLVYDQIEERYENGLKEVHQLRSYTDRLLIRADDLADGPWMLRKNPDIGTRLKGQSDPLPRCDFLLRFGILDWNAVDFYEPGELLEHVQRGFRTWTRKQDLLLDDLVKRRLASGK
ncbi:Fc.00g027860.m01.CDS01 [Cosmosporella sp. VM-42]